MNKELKVLSLVSYKFLPPDMGGQKGIGFFNRYLGKHLDLRCVTTRDNSPAASEGYPVMPVLSNSKLRYLNPFYIFKLRRIVREYQITHLIIEHPYYGWLGLALKWLCHVKLIVHSHNIESLRFKSMGNWWWGILWNYEKYVHRNAHFSFFIHDDDRNYAIEHFKLDPGKCETITYGFEHSSIPSAAEKSAARKMICQAHKIDETEKVLLFNGTLGYKPNLEALNVILEKINPLLLVEKGFRYKIIICGNKLPAAYNGLFQYKEKNIIYAGFVEDINQYFKGADIFINPVTEGGGIKTKLVESLGYNLSVVSTDTGAIGIPVNATGGKMKLVADNDWVAFAGEVTRTNTGLNTPQDFYDHFYWGNIAAKAAAVLKERTGQ